MDSGKFDPNAIVAEYKGRYHQFRELATQVGERCKKTTSSEGILATVSWRAKSLDSFSAKVRQKKFKMRILEGVSWWEAIQDLAAVRICTYRDSDRSRVVEILSKTMAVDNGSIVVLDETRARETGRRRWYSGTHLQVRLPTSLLEEDDKALAELTCEVQICSLLSHAWNEVEHDIGYKAPYGLSDELDLLLCQLGECKSQGDELVERILTESETDILMSKRISQFSNLTISRRHSKNILQVGMLRI